MKVVIKDKMPDGTDIQIEDWSENYPNVHKFGDLVVAYPISKYITLDEHIRQGERFRCELNFKTHEQALEAFENLKNGTKTLLDYDLYINIKHYKLLGGE